MNTNIVTFGDSILGQKIADTIGILSEKLGVASDHFYPIFVRQQFIEGCTYVASFGLLFLILLSIFNYLNKSNWCERDDEDSRFPKIIGFFLLTLIFWIALFVAGPKTISCLFNPEYQAIMDIIRQIK